MCFSSQDNAISLSRPRNLTYERETINNGEIISVCKFAEDFALEDGSVEMTMNGKKFKRLRVVIKLDNFHFIDCSH